MTKLGCFLIVSLVTLALITGCNDSAQLEKRAPQDVALVKSWFELLRRGDVDQVEDLVDPSMQDSIPHSLFVELAATIPRESPNSVKPVFVETRCEEGVCKEGIVLEYKYTAERLLFNLSLVKESSSLSIVGIRLTVVPDSFMKDNEFTLSNKGLKQYLILTLAIVAPILSLYTLVLCVRRLSGTRRWLWAVFVLLGFGKVVINWTTGELQYDFRTIQLLSVDAFSVPYGPWIISVSLPIGAILFLFKYRIFSGSSAEKALRQGRFRELEK
jgi:hypothetical protein